MADQLRWFKVWTTILLDPGMAAMDLADIGRWARLGALATAVGERGILDFTQDGNALLATLKVGDLEAAKCALLRLPGVHFEEGKNRYGGITVTFKNWRKYQLDSTVAFRMKTLRAKRRGEERRVDKRRA